MISQCQVRWRYFRLAQIISNSSTEFNNHLAIKSRQIRHGRMVALDHFLIVEQIVEKIVGFRLKTPNFAKKNDA